MHSNHRRLESPEALWSAPSFECIVAFALQFPIPDQSPVHFSLSHFSSTVHLAHFSAPWPPLVWPAAAPSYIPLAPQPQQAEPPRAWRSSPVPRLLATPYAQQAPPLRSFPVLRPPAAHDQTSPCLNPPPAPTATSRILPPKPIAARLVQVLPPTPLANLFAAPPTRQCTAHQR